MTDTFRLLHVLQAIERHLRPWPETSEKTNIPPYHIDLRAHPMLRPRTHRDPVPFVDRGGWHTMPGDKEGQLLR